MHDLYKLAKPFIFKLDPERAHHLSLRALKSGLVPSCPAQQNPALEQSLWGLKFPNPVGLAAGFDKEAAALSAIFKLGFGFVEAGTVTPKPQEGNPKPRIFRDERSQAVINRMGFPGSGVHVFKNNLTDFLSAKNKPTGVLGINIGMNKDQKEPAKDYVLLIRMLGPMADYITINISSPNTPGLRDLQKREFLLELIGTLKDERLKACGKEFAPPLILKLAPDLSEAQQEELATTALEAEIDGLILSNTTLARPEHLPAEFAAEKGGLSGQPLTGLATTVLRNFYTLTKGKIPLIGAGGVANAEQAYARIKAGASLIQLYSALVFEGPNVAHSINKDLSALLQKDGYKHISEAIGADHKSAQ